MIKNSNSDTLKKNMTWDFASVILVQPSKPQNLGNIARVMMNFGFSNLIITNPILDLSNPEIKVVARRADMIINQAQLVMDLQDVRESFDFMIGTTARVGSDYNLKRITIPPERLLKEEFSYNKIAIVFGREPSGLSNEEISICDLLVTIPTHSTYPVMNLSHAVTIILYFLSQKFQDIYQNSKVKLKHRAASFRERQQLESYFEQVINFTGYRPEKHHVALQAFSNVLSRGYVTGRELTTLMGVMKWIYLKLQNINE
ncbi:MAG: TrmJ/YjtD family RNA methyltransferase [Candidatus Heimdallarchaeota archaeon]|nr:MAG: TrmJ/YjtD family RNA methyltransferase [Candidatus Heimdallarchaeota archaeon]